jgi:copper chaperone CopZ
MPKSKDEATATLKLRQMNEKGRAQRLKLAIGSLDGISKVDINYILDTVTVTYDSSDLTLAQIKKKVDRSATR